MLPQKPPAREQEQSIRDRKATLFEKEQKPKATGPAVARKPFAEHLRNTPPMPLPAGTRMLLWAAGVVVLALPVVAVLRG